MSITDGTILRVVASMAWLDANVAQNVYNAVVTGGGGPWDEDDIVQDAKTWLDDMYLNVAAQMSDELDGTTVTVYEYDSVDDDWDEVGLDTWVYNFTQASAELPRGCAPLVNLKTTDPDVSGKKYLPGFSEAGVDAGLLTAGAMTDIVAYALDLMTPFAGSDSAATWTPGIWSPTRGIFYASSLVALTSNVVAYQRRRKRGVGI